MIHSKSPEPGLVPAKRIFFIGWLLTYLMMIALVVGGVIYGRNRALAIYGSSAAPAEWDQWRADAQKITEQPSTVKRRDLDSVKTPELVLIRESFADWLGVAIHLSTDFFG